MKSEFPKKRGPKPTGVGTPVMVRLQPDLLSALDAFSEGHPDKPSRPEAVRLILKDRLAAGGTEIGNGFVPNGSSDSGGGTDVGGG